MKKQDVLTKLLNINYPVVQGPMLGVTTPQMVATITNAGGLGSLPVGGLSPELTAQLIHSTKQLTKKTFAVNLFAHNIPAEPDEKNFLAMQDFLEIYSKSRGLPFTRKKSGDLRFYSYLEQVDVLLKEKIPVVSVTFGLLSPEVIAKFKEKGTILIGTATSLEEALALQAAGMDIITAQGFEAGGHRGSFLLENGLPQVGLFSLLPELADAVNLPVLAAGGITDARTIRAAFTLGAAGVQVGTLFIPSADSAASDSYKRTILSTRQTDTVLTKAFTGRWARGIKNDLMVAIETSGLTIPDYTLQNNLSAPLRAYGQQNGIPDIVSMWAGQSLTRIREGSTAAIFEQLIGDINFQEL